MKQSFTFFLVVVIFIWSAPANSATVEYNGSDVTGITNIVLGDTHYNVDFVFGTYDDIFAGTFDVTDWSVAQNLVSSINSELNSESPVPTTVGPGHTGDIYWIPLSLQPVAANAVAGYYSVNPSPWDIPSTTTVIRFANTTYARIETVPIPGAVWLLGSGLITLIGLRRRSIKS